MGDKKIQKIVKRWVGDNLVSEVIEVDTDGEETPVVPEEVKAENSEDKPETDPSQEDVRDDSEDEYEDEYTKSELMAKQKADLIHICEEMELDTDGTKEDLADRILEAQNG